MAVNPLEILQAQAPNAVTASASITQIINAIMLIVILSALLFALVKFMGHRILVEQLIRVKGGYVARAGRYALKTDRSSGLQYLKPMFGRERLPNFPTKAFQKSKGMPFIGIMRELSLIKLNQYNFLVSLPSYGVGREGQTYEYNTLNHVFLEQRREFIKKHNKARFAELVTMAAPLVVILISFFMIAWVMYLGIRTDTQNAQFLTEQLRIAQQALK